MRHAWCRIVLAGVVLGGVALFAPIDPVEAGHPPAPKLLPDRTVAFLRIPDTRELVEKFKQTSTGRLAADEKIRPLLQDLYGSAIDATKQIEEVLGLSLDDLIKLPQGELCFAVVDPEVYEESGNPVFVAILDVGKNQSKVEKLLERGTELATQDGAKSESRPFGDQEIKIIRKNDGVIVTCVREGTVLIATSEGAMEDLLASWDGLSETRKLADNRKFVSIVRASAGTKEESPQWMWYVDPISFLRIVARDNTGLRTAMVLFPMLGVDGIKALGGSSILATEEFDSIAHMHIMLDSPPRGVLKMLQLKQGDVEPESWVPTDVTTYMSGYFDLPQAFVEFETVLARVRGEGAVRRAVEERVTRPLGIDLEKDVLEQWSGRITYLQWFEPPSRINSQTNTVGIQLNHPDRFKKTLDAIVSRSSGRMVPATFRSARYFRIEVRRQNPPPGDLIRRATPCVAIVGDYLIVTDSEPMLKEIIKTKKSGGPSLGSELDFKLVSSRIKSHLGSSKASMIAFQRPGEALRGVYEMATSKAMREQLAKGAEGNKALKALYDALRRNELPPFSEITKYLAPGGGVLVKDETGIHYMAFGLKRDVGSSSP